MSKSCDLGELYKDLMDAFDTEIGPETAAEIKKMSSKTPREKRKRSSGTARHSLGKKARPGYNQYRTLWLASSNKDNADEGLVFPELDNKTVEEDESEETDVKVQKVVQKKAPKRKGKPPGPMYLARNRKCFFKESQAVPFSCMEDEEFCRKLAIPEEGRPRIANVLMHALVVANAGRNYDAGEGIPNKYMIFLERFLLNGGSEYKLKPKRIEYLCATNPRTGEPYFEDGTRLVPRINVCVTERACSFILFRSGTIRIQGMRSIVDAKFCAHHFIATLQEGCRKVDLTSRVMVPTGSIIHTPIPKLQMEVRNFEMGGTTSKYFIPEVGKIRLSKLSCYLEDPNFRFARRSRKDGNCEDTNYNTEVFSSCDYWPWGKKENGRGQIARFFSTGCVNLLGPKTHEEIYKLFRKTYPTALKFGSDV